MGWAWETREGRGRGCVGDNKPDASAVSGGTGLQVHSMGADLRASFECKSRGQTQGTISDKGAPTTPLHAGRHRQGIRSCKGMHQGTQRVSPAMTCRVPLPAIADTSDGRRPSWEQVYGLVRRPFDE
ncbi:hypothetical protein BN1723_011098 [Verticillium longisporum]|uniref:Uncharacterized protein n=1 Tax=Verticillium longisporum TaxID=100787 RepID=A0A0G4L486_VERLO|nr:hypothetical protein BN1723_011098 [Verticillium longisporum]